MIFKHTLHQVVGGGKTQTRRIIKPNERLDTVRNAVMVNNRITYQVGKSYAVQPNRGKPAVARIIITDIRCESVDDITEQGAICEGFQSRDAFLITWRLIHGRDADMSRKVWVFEFRLEGENEQ